MSNLTFLGENNLNGNCGVMFGTAATDTPYIASKFTVENSDFKSFAEYGMFIYATSDFTINNVRILNHGD